jgi:hypothetical protein
MQKMITVTIDTKMLSAMSRETFSIQEVDVVNELLEIGWYMEEWEFLNEEPDEDGKMSLIAVLNDDQINDEEAYTSFSSEEDEEDEEDPEYTDDSTEKTDEKES